MIIDLLVIFFKPFIAIIGSAFEVFISILPSIKMLSIEYWICLGLGIPLLVLTIINYCLKKSLKKKSGDFMP